MGHMKNIYMLQRNNLIEDLAIAYEKAVDADKESFIFEGSYMYTHYAKKVLEYVQKHPLRKQDSEYRF
tara:strand:- start:1571 stop:1774 length:204 start_codon:yes stop_codon:yes gene_type:complete